MRDAVAEIIRYNRGFDSESLRRKLSAMSAASPFDFFRATFHIFAADLSRGYFALPEGLPSGRIAGDLHAENFGTFRCITNEIVYEVNDFDDTAIGAYEIDLRRLLASLVVGGQEHGLKQSECVAVCEAAMDEYLLVIAQFAKAKKREELAKLQEGAAVKRLLTEAGEKSRVAMLEPLVQQDPKSGAYTLKPSKKLAELDGRRVRAIQEGFPAFLKSCKAPAGAETGKFVFEDAKFRFAGKGSLGRERYAILLRKGLKDREGVGDVRLIEWKESFDSPLDSGIQRTQSSGRAMDVLEAALLFQLIPKRYCGFATVGGRPFQTKEIGANDDRFDSAQYGDARKLTAAAGVFGGIAARAHLLASFGVDEGPRKMGAIASLSRRLVAFALHYAEQTLADFEDFKKRKEEVAAAWKL